MFGAPSDNALRERRPNTGKPCDFAHVCMIEIYALPGKERTSKLSGAASRLAQRIGTERRCGLQLDITGRGRGGGSEKVANAGTGEGEGGKQESSAFIIH